MRLKIRRPIGFLSTLIGSLAMYVPAHAAFSTAATVKVNANWGAALNLSGVSMASRAHRPAARRRAGVP